MREVLIRGNEFLFARKLAELLQMTSDSLVRDFNFDRFSIKSKGVGYFEDLAMTAPVMVASRIIVAEDVDQLTKEDAPRLAQVLPRIPDSTFVIFICSKLNRTTVLGKALATSYRVHEFKDPYQDKIPEWIVTLASERGLKLSNDVASQMADVIGNDLMQATRELEKLAIYIHPRTSISATDVDELVSRGLTRNIFELGEFIARNKLFEAQKLFRHMNETDELYMIMGLVVLHFRRLLLASDYTQKNGARGDLDNMSLSRILGTNPFFVKNYLKQAAGLGKNKLRNIYKELMQISIDMRQTGLKDSTLFEGFLTRACELKN